MWRLWVFWCFGYYYFAILILLQIKPPTAAHNAPYGDTLRTHPRTNHTSRTPITAKTKTTPILRFAPAYAPYDMPTHDARRTHLRLPAYPRTTLAQRCTHNYPEWLGFRATTTTRVHSRTPLTTPRTDGRHRHVARPRPPCTFPPPSRAPRRAPVSHGCHRLCNGTAT